MRNIVDATKQIPYYGVTTEGTEGSIPLVEIDERRPAMTTVTDTSRRKLGEHILDEQRAARARLKGLEREALPAGELGGDNTPLADPLEAARRIITEIETEGSREALIRRLKKLYRAAEKVRDGSYGTCDLCEEPIPPARLRALPEAVHCRDCAQELERQFEQAARRGGPVRGWAEPALPAAA
jgi:DnaK suppressor protein